METPYRFAPADALLECPDELADKVVGAAIKVHRYFGPGQFERIYQEALAIELTEEGIPFQTEVKMEVAWRGHKLGVGFRADMVVSDCLVLELKCVENIAPVHEAQLIGYLRLLRIKTGMILNFHSKLLKDGIRRRSI